MSTYNKWGREYRQVISSAQEKNARRALGNTAVCPQCGRTAVARVYNATKNIWEYKHSKRVRVAPSGFITETAWCKVAV